MSHPFVFWDLPEEDIGSLILNEQVGDVDDQRVARKEKVKKHFPAWPAYVLLGLLALGLLWWLSAREKQMQSSKSSKGGVSEMTLAQIAQGLRRSLPESLQGILDPDNLENWKLLPPKQGDRVYLLPKKGTKNHYWKISYDKIQREWVLVDPVYDFECVPGSPSYPECLQYDGYKNYENSDNYYNRDNNNRDYHSDYENHNNSDHWHNGSWSNRGSYSDHDSNRGGGSRSEGSGSSRGGSSRGGEGGGGGHGR
jgi:hypothetical protein